MLFAPKGQLLNREGIKLKPFAPTVSCVCGCSRDSTNSWRTGLSFLSRDAFSERNLKTGLKLGLHPLRSSTRSCNGSAPRPITCLVSSSFLKTTLKAELFLMIKSLEGRLRGKIAQIFFHASIFYEISWTQHSRHFDFYHIITLSLLLRIDVLLYVTIKQKQ